LLHEWSNGSPWVSLSDEFIEVLILEVHVFEFEVFDVLNLLSCDESEKCELCELIKFLTKQTQ
jgi:hypothetical protein